MTFSVKFDVAAAAAGCGDGHGKQAVSSGLGGEDIEIGSWH